LPSELLTSKLYIPPLRPNLVSRPRLIQLLSEGLQSKRKLTLISAPPGFGKTTLVVSWLKKIDCPAAWLSLEEADNDLPRFMAYLAAAFQQVDEEIGTFLVGALQSTKPSMIKKVLTALLNEIALRIDPLILVLDDYHHLSETAVLEVMEFLLQNLPPQLHLVLTTREDPAFPLARLRSRDQITDIRAWDLRFTQEETDAFLRSVMGLDLSKQDVAALEDRTEGWVAGLQLAGLSMQRQADLKAFIADFSGSHRHILDYLTDEVLQHQPGSIRAFFLHTSILDRLCGPLCDAVTGQIDSDQLLIHLEAANLFIIPLDEERRWYRYHHLFADLLRRELIRTQPDILPDLHRRASRWYEKVGDIEAAVSHALQDPDLTEAAHLIEKHAIPQLYKGKVTMMVNWFDGLPESVLESAPMLCIGKAWALALMHRSTRWGEIDQVLEVAERALVQANADTALREIISGHAASIRAYILGAPTQVHNNPEKLIALSLEAQRLLPDDEKAIRSLNALNIGYSYMTMSDLESARRAFIQSLEDGLAGGNYYAAIFSFHDLILERLMAGNLQDALQLCETYIERFNKILAGQYFPHIGVLYILKGTILLEYNRLKEAESVLTEGLELVRWTGGFLTHKKGYTALAHLRAIQGDQSGMLMALKTLEETWPEQALYVQALRHYLSLHDRPADLVLQQEAHSWLAQSGIDFNLLAVIESVDLVSMNVFETRLYAAHVLARLVEQHPDAYPSEAPLKHLRRQQEFAERHGIVTWVIAISIARAVLYQVLGEKEAALEMLELALRAAAPTGFLRIFLDECVPLQDLLEELMPRLEDKALIAYANRLLESFDCGPTKPETRERPAELLSERELEVLQNLARGLTYERIGQELFLSLNTVQFHVKNIYRKLLVNKRVLAIEKARELNLI
jgi:LuxR family maltose regulon positive regulatory protein